MRTRKNVRMWLVVMVVLLVGALSPMAVSAAPVSGSGAWDCPPPQPPHKFWGRADEFAVGAVVEIFGAGGDLYAETKVIYDPLVWREESFGKVYWVFMPFDDPCTDEREGPVWRGAWYPDGEFVPEQLTFKVNGQVVAKAPFGPPLIDPADVPGSTRLDLYKPADRGIAAGCVFFSGREDRVRADRSQRPRW